MYLQCICIYIIIELKVYNILCQIVFFFSYITTLIVRKKTTSAMSNFNNYSYKSIILLIMINLPAVNPDEK